MAGFDHVEFQVKSFEPSLKFYSACLPSLGYKLKFSGNGAMGFGSGDSVDLLLSAGTPTTPRMHIAFKATSEAQVQEFYKMAIETGGTCNGMPGLRVEYGPGYYAAFILDPDGHNIEALFRK